MPQSRPKPWMLPRREFMKGCGRCHGSRGYLPPAIITGRTFH